MAKTIDKIKGKILEQVLSQNELENIMAEYRYHPVEKDDDIDTIFDGDPDAYWNID